MDPMDLSLSVLLGIAVEHMTKIQIPAEGEPSFLWKNIEPHLIDG
jgi:hypothetical protein